jgi:recombination protein RecR
MRDQEKICVVEDYLDMVAIERVGIFRGRYHVLGGAISPIHGIMPANLTITHLFERIQSESSLTEIILAMNPNIE